MDKKERKKEREREKGGGREREGGEMRDSLKENSERATK